MSTCRAAWVRMGSHRRQQVRKRLLRRDGPHCFWCGIRFSEERHEPPLPNQCTVDHIVPFSAGGVIGDDNSVLSCWTCNHERDDMPAEEWLAIAMSRRRELASA